MKDPQGLRSFWFLFFLVSVVSTLLTCGSMAVAQDTIVDNGAGEGAITSTGTWEVSGGTNPYGADSVWARGGDDTFSFHFAPTRSGTYDVYEWHSGWSSRANAVPHVITHAGGSQSVTVNQQLNAGKWNKLGTYSFQAGGNYSVTITSTVSTTASTCADAIRWTLVEPADEPPPTSLSSIVDNRDGGGAVTSTGTWEVSGGTNPYGADSVWARGGDDTFSFHFTPTRSGTYDVYEWHSGWSSRTNAAPHVITHAGGSQTVTVNQQLNPGKWNKLGTYDFQAGVSYSVTITSAVSTTASTCADAIQWTLVGATNASPTASISSISPNPATVGQTVTFSGSGTDPDGAIAGYRWTSNLDGTLNESGAEFSVSTLTAGTHTISFQVVDNAGAWSPVATSTLTVNADTAAEEHMFFCLGYGSGKTMKANIQSLLKKIGAIQDGSVWRYTNAKKKQFVFHFVQDMEGMRQALYTPGAHVVYKGHANYGLGALFVNATEEANQTVENLYTIDDPRIFNISSPLIHVSVRGLRTSQAFPNWWPEFLNGDSGIAPYTTNSTEINQKRLAGYPHTTPPYNYYIPYRVGSDTYTAETVRMGAIQRFPDSGKPAWDFRDGSQPPAGSAYYLTNYTPWTRSLEITGNWANAYDLADLFRDDYLYLPAGNGSNRVEYFFTVTAPGTYRVLSWWPSSASNSTSAGYIVNHANGSTPISVDQSVQGGRWNEIGQFDFNAGEYSVVVSDTAGSGRVVADGIRISALENPPAVIQADFVADVRYGTAPLDVTFESMSTGDVSTYQWDFGDWSTNSSRTYITHTYTSPGTYDVSFTVNGPDGSSTRTKKAYIVVGSTSPTPPLLAEFSAGTHEGTAPLTVSFTDRSSGDVTTRLWSFGDGTTSTAQNPSHQYTEPGNYTVSLSVNGSSTETKTNFVVAKRYDKILDNVDYPKAHYRSKTILFRKDTDFEIDKSQLKYNRLYYEACNSGNYYLDTFNRGTVFYTLNTANGLAFSAYVRGYVAGKTDLQIWQDMQAIDPVYDYYNFNKIPSEQ